MQRRDFLKGCIAAGIGLSFNARAKPAVATIEVYKSASCGCCTEWVKHLQANGFRVNARNVPNPSDYREKYGIPQSLGSCHTGVVEGYALEGHVPAREVKRLLAERPKAKGLTVPGMPVGSPGMEVEGMGSDAFDVLLVRADGGHEVFARYEGKDAPSGKAAASGAQPSMTEGQVKKVDRKAGTITIRHGRIANLDMPPMTMEFQVKDKAMLRQVKAGDKISFMADKVGEDFAVVSIDVNR
jgi:Cu/Ag efflux protein CusF